MRVFKPQYLTPLVSVFDDGRRLHCVLSALIHANFEGELVKDQELWFYATQETEGMVVDEAMPKTRGEWLVHGSCYARKPDVRQSFVKATVGEQEKVLAVFGPRAYDVAGVHPSLSKAFLSNSGTRSAAARSRKIPSAPAMAAAFRLKSKCAATSSQGPSTNLPWPVSGASIRPGLNARNGWARRTTPGG